MVIVCLVHVFSSTFPSVLSLREGMISLLLACEICSDSSRVIFELFNDTVPETAEK